MSGTSIERRPSGGGDPSHDPHGAVEQAPHGAVVSYNPDAPSEEWGWHGHWSEFAPRGRFLLLGLGVFGLIAMAVFGNHVSHVEDYFLIIIALMMAAWMLRTARIRKRERRIRP